MVQAAHLSLLICFPDSRYEPCFVNARARSVQRLVYTADAPVGKAALLASTVSTCRMQSKPVGKPLTVGGGCNVHGMAQQHPHSRFSVVGEGRVDAPVGV